MIVTERYPWVGGAPWELRLLILVVALATSAGMSVVVTRPERYQQFWQRWYGLMRMGDPTMTAVKCVRLAIPSTLLSWAIITFCLFGFVSGVTEKGAARPAPIPAADWLDAALLPVALALLGAIVLLSVLLLVVGRTGQPKVLVLRPCRDMTERESAAWLSPAGDRPHNPSRRRRGPDV